MKKFLIALPISLLLFSCGEDKETTESEADPKEQGSDNSGEISALQKENEDLKQQLDQQSAALSESASLIQEITENLSKISYERGKIRKVGMNPELDEDPKQYIVAEINALNELQQQNAAKIAALNSSLKKAKSELGEKNTTITSLNALVESLNNQLMVSEQENQALRNQLDALDHDYANLFDDYLVASDKVENLTDEVNTAYYAYGTKKELKENNVISKEGGFIGLGGSNKLSDDFNGDYFQKIDITQTREIELMGKKPELVTSHPSSSYELVEGDNSVMLKINDIAAFWSASKYLVVTVQ